MSLLLTERAAQHIKFRDGVGAILKITAAPDGCTGMTYHMEMVDSIDDSDYVYESYGITIITDTHSLPFIDGTVIDYTKSAFAEGFTYNNPNVKNCCGCGQSFTTGE